jgi:tetratricopeptide (TPR) repeat protein
MVSYCLAVVSLNETALLQSLESHDAAQLAADAAADEHAPRLQASDEFAAVKTAGDLYHAAGRLEAARACYAKCVDLSLAALSSPEDADDPHLKERLANSYTDLAGSHLAAREDVGTAISCFFSALECDINSYRSFTGLALAFHQQNEPELAVAAASHGIDKEAKEEVRRRLHLGDSISSSCRHFLTSHSLVAQNAEGWGCLSRLYVEGVLGGQSGVSEEVVNKCLENLSHVCDESMNWVLRGLSFLHQDRRLDAHTSFETSFANKCVRERESERVFFIAAN